MHDKSTCIVCLMDEAMRKGIEAVHALSKMSDSERKKCLEEASNYVADKVSNG